MQSHDEILELSIVKSTELISKENEGQLTQKVQDLASLVGDMNIEQTKGDKDSKILSIFQSSELLRRNFLSILDEYV